VTTDRPPATQPVADGPPAGPGPAAGASAGGVSAGQSLAGGQSAGPASAQPIGAQPPGDGAQVDRPTVDGPAAARPPAEPAQPVGGNGAGDGGRPPFDRTATTVGQLARFGFADAARDSTLLAELGLWDPVEQRPADVAAYPVLQAFTRVAPADLTVRQLHRLASAQPGNPAGTGGLLSALRTNASLRERLLAVLSASETLGDHLVANPGEWRTLAAPNGYMLRFEGDSVPRLRMAYRRSLLRIAAGDLTGALDVEQTMTALSALADATLQAAYRLACAERGVPVSGPGSPDLAVVAMGKCGGRELNYVSDVDVIFVCATDEDLPAATAVAARLMAICGLVAWPVDAALRPEGSQGPLVRTLASHLAYYQRWARTWEFQALLKARPAAGDLALGEQWLAALQPLI